MRARLRRMTACSLKLLASHPPLATGDGDERASDCWIMFTMSFRPSGSALHRAHGVASSGCLAVCLSGCLAVWLSGCATVVAGLTVTAIYEREGSPCVVDHSACRVIMSGGPPRAGSTAPEICVTSHPIVMRHGASLVRGQRMPPHRALISRGRVPVTPELTLPSRAGGEGRADQRGGTLRGCRTVSPFIICRSARSDTVDDRDDMPVSSSPLWSRSGRSSAPAPTDVPSSPHR